MKQAILSLSLLTLLVSCVKEDEPQENDSPVTPGGKESLYKYVDLGLPSGLKWATHNVGAENSKDFGDYFAWGETEQKQISVWNEVEQKNIYNWSTYKWCNGSDEYMTKYCTSSHYGVVDGKIVLDLEDDVAHVQWGGNWRMPTKDEQDELCSKCIWTWIAQDGMIGYKLVGPNGNSIFLPAAGYRHNGILYDVRSYGYYWSSSLSTSSSDDAYNLYFNSNCIDGSDDGRCLGQSVRPVYDDRPKPQHEYVDLGLPSGLKWATCNVGATSPNDCGGYYAWGETEQTQTFSWNGEPFYDWGAYKWYNGADGINSYYSVDGGKIVLNLEDDVAHVQWGDNWRMPTFAELDELKTQCTWTWTELKGVYGFRVVGPNGHSIFLPAAGYRYEDDLIGVGLNGFYWSSSLSTSSSYDAYYVYFRSNYINWGGDGRCLGQSVRPVYAE